MYKHLVRTESNPYHLFARANNKEWFYIPIAEVWEIFCGFLDYLSRTRNLKIHAFVLMSNHFHLLASTPDANLDEIMQILMREASKKINERSDRINHVFGAPYKWCLIRNGFQYMQAYRYVYQNPLRAGLCTNVQDYPYSTISYLVQEKELPFALVPSEYESKFAELRLPYIYQLPWLNRNLNNEEADCMRRALKHREFELRAVKNKRSLPPSLIEGHYLFQNRQEVPSPMP